MYDIPVAHVAGLLGPKLRTIRRWYSLFLRDGIVNAKAEHKWRQRWPDEVLQAVKTYVQDHPTFYIEALRDHIVLLFSELPNVSTSTICRMLNFDLNLSRKVLSKAAREAVTVEIEASRRNRAPSICLQNSSCFSTRRERTADMPTVGMAGHDATPRPS
jgi:hypothetical protein